MSGRAREAARAKATRARLSEQLRTGNKRTRVGIERLTWEDFERIKDALGKE